MPRRGARKTSKITDQELLEPLQSFDLPYNEQLQSPLFSVLPREVLDLICEHAFTDYEDMANPYGLETVYRRPEYMAPRKIETSLLRTCQAIYLDAWYLPWNQIQHTMFLTAGDRRPRSTTSADELARMAWLVKKLHPEAPDRRKQIHNLQVFAQACELEPGHKLQHLLSIPQLKPRIVTVTVRHTDCWYWEWDDCIMLRADWVNSCRFPESVTSLRIQIESLERKALQVGHLLVQARKNWTFQRRDGILLEPQGADQMQITRWSGPSTLLGERWIRDEQDEKPGLLHYYLATISFHPSDRPVSTRQQAVTIHCSAEVAEKTRHIWSGQASISVNRMKDLGITNDMDRNETRELVRASTNGRLTTNSTLG